jgi:hypothetical protein
MYVGDTDITLILMEKDAFSHLLISSVNRNNPEKLFIDNTPYLKHIDENKKDLKKKLREKNLWEPGVIKAIKLLTKNNL